MKIRNIVILLFFVLVSSVFLGILFSNLLLVDYTEVDAYLTVGSHLGFNLDSDALYLGTVLPGFSGNRDLVVNNEDCSKCKVNIRSEGDLSRWLVISNNNFVIREGEERKVNVAVFVPQDAEFGNYTAKIKIYFWKTF